MILIFQSRYVAYYECVVKNDRIIPDSPVLAVTGFTIKAISSVGVGNASEFTITIKGRDEELQFEAVVGVNKNCRVSRLLDSTV